MPGARDDFRHGCPDDLDSARLQQLWHPAIKVHRHQGSTVNSVGVRVEQQQNFFVSNGGEMKIRPDAGADGISQGDE